MPSRREPREIEYDLFYEEVYHPLEILSIPYF